MKNEDSFFEIDIVAVNSSGQGIGTLDGLKVFIDLALPGERIKAQIIEKKKKYAIARLVKVLEKSPDRQEPICPIFTFCGGCQIMHWKYDKQLEYKSQRVQEALMRIGGLENPPVLPCIPSPSPLYYRNKIQLPFFEKDGHVSMGLYKKHSNEVVEVETCYIHCEIGQKIYASLQELLKNSPLRVFNPEKRKGFLRHLLIRTAVKTRECLIVFITASGLFKKELLAIAETLMAKHPELKGVLQNVNKKRFNSILGDELFTLKGRPYIYEEIKGLRLKISAHAFFQVNPAQAANLYQTAIALADLKKEDSLLDAYCGIGMFALFAASKVKSVLGIESVSSAVENAKENAKLNELPNVRFKCDRVEHALDTLTSIDAVFVNPPRKGCEASVLEAFSKMKIKKIIYVSCDPATLSRDIAYLKDKGYNLIKVQPLDMFPQTTHVESVALLVRED